MVTGGVRVKRPLPILRLAPMPTWTPAQVRAFQSTSGADRGLIEADDAGRLGVFDVGVGAQGSLVDSLAGAAVFRLMTGYGCRPGRARGVHGTGPCLPDGCLRSIRVSAAHSSTGEFWQMVFPRLRAIQDRSWGE